MSKTKFIFPITFLLACFLTFIIYLIPKEFNSQILKLIALISILYILFPFLKTNVKWVLYYFFCIDNYWWEKRVQRPRILIYILYFGIFYLSFAELKYGEKDVLGMITNFLFFLYLIFGVLLLGNFIWKSEFETSLLNEIKVLISDEISLKLYSKNEIEDFIKDNIENIHSSSIDDFRNFLSGNPISNKIKWIGTSGKNVVTYTGLFYMTHTLLKEGNELFIKKQRRKFLEFICENFEKYENDLSIAIKYENLNSAYSSFNLKKYSK